MNLLKLTLATSLLLASSAFAISHVKVAGNAKLFYSTNDTNHALFNAKNSTAQASLHLGILADLAPDISAGSGVTALSMLGLKPQLASSTWEGTNGTADSYVVNTAWLAGTFSKTTGKIGRMLLDTPLIFSENWSTMTNSFEGVTLINRDLANTTLLAAYIGGSNGTSFYNQNGNTHLDFSHNPAVEINGKNGLADRIQAVKNGSTFSQFYNGVYAVGAINNSIKPLKLQAWYYNAPQYIQAWWLEADFNTDGLIVGAQYAGVHYDFDQITQNLRDSNDGYAFKLGYKIKNIATITGAISQIGKNNNNLGVGGNLAELGNNAESKLYTEAWWNFGYVTRANTTAENLTITSAVDGLFDLGVYYIHASRPGFAISGTDLSYRGGSKVPVTDNGHDDGNMNELTVTADKSFKAGDQNNNVGYSTLQAYLTYNF